MSTTDRGPNWTCVNEEAAWQARDSQGEMVFDGHMWIFGGWFTPQTPNPRDVWKSADGVNWTCTTQEAAWTHGDLPATMPFKDRMWLMGGRKLPGAENTNTVWSSSDGADWRLETDDPGWCPRVSPSFAVFKDRMWLMGGTQNFYLDNDDTLQNDVWSTADGTTWKLEVEHAAWSKRTHAQVTVFKDRLWLMGGGAWHPETIPRNDVWSSADGITWDLVTEAAPWTARMWFSLVAYRDHLWVLGGWNKEDGNFGDVWYSKDGEHWTQMTADNIWSKRHEHSAWVFDDKIWLAGGHAEPLNSEVWSLELPGEWTSD